MSTGVVQPRRIARWQVVLPIVIVLLGSAVMGASYWLPSAEFSRTARFAIGSISFMATGFLLTLWLLFLSGLRWTRRLALFAVEAAVLISFVRYFEVIFDGDMVPLTLVWRKAPGADLATRPNRALEGTEKVETAATDFPAYMNAGRDGVVQGPPLVRSLEGLKPVWRHDVGGGYSGFAVVGKALITLEQRGGDETVVCYDARTGEQVWATGYSGYFREGMGGDGPRATPTVYGDKVYSLGATGHLVCLNLVDGKELWAAEILKDNENLQWAMCGSPLVTESAVIVTPGEQKPGGKGHAVIAYDPKTGSELWRAGDYKTGYASPMLATLSGVQQILIFDADGLAGYDVGGKGELWRYEFPGFNGINVAQPIVWTEDRVFITSGYGKGCALVRVGRSGDTWKADEIWKTKALRAKFGSAVLHRDHVYGLDDGVLACVDLQTGERTWRAGKYGHGQLLIQDDLLVVLTEQGRLAVVEATPTEFHELGVVDAIRAPKTWNPLALADGRAYVRNAQEMACFDLRAGR